MRLLIVEKDPHKRLSLEKALKSDGFVIDGAGDGETGLDLVASGDYDAIILDEDLPRMDALRFCRELRQAGESTPVLLLMASASHTDRSELLDAGVDDFLGKPISYSELRFRIHTLLRRPRILPPALLRVDDLVMDTLSQRVRRGQKEIYLTRKEFALMEYLIRNRGSVVSRPLLLHHVWDNGIDAFSNTIEAHILNLRKKIDRGSKAKLIHTVPGRGYKLEAPGTTIFS